MLTDEEDPEDVIRQVSNIAQRLVNYYQADRYYYDVADGGKANASGTEDEYALIESMDDDNLINEFALAIAQGVNDALIGAADDAAKVASTRITPESFSPEVAPFADLMNTATGFRAGNLEGPPGEIPQSLLEAIARNDGVTVYASPQAKPETWVGLLYKLISPLDGTIEDAYRAIAEGDRLSGYTLHLSSDDDTLHVDCNMKIGVSNYNIMNSFHKSDTQEVYGVCLLTGVVLAHTVTAEGRDLLANIMVDLSAKNTVPVDFIFGGENGDQTTEPDSPGSKNAAKDDEKSDIPALEMSEIAEAVAGVLSDQDSYPDVEYIDVLDAIEDRKSVV